MGMKMIPMTRNVEITHTGLFYWVNFCWSGRGKRSLRENRGPSGELLLLEGRVIGLVGHCGERANSEVDCCWGSFVVCVKTVDFFFFRGGSVSVRRAPPKKRVSTKLFLCRRKLK